MSSALTLVVAAVIERRGRWLLAQRPPHKHHGGLWEFPGGKVAPGETPQAALARELAEELALSNVAVDAECFRMDDTDTGLTLSFYRVFTDAAPVPLEHPAIGWYKGVEAMALPLAPLDRACVRHLLELTDGTTP